MMLDSENEKNKPSLEDLLRVKRSEKPPEDFWRGFDRDLEKKIVRSVVHRESGVQSFLRWIYYHGKLISAACCLLVVCYFFLASDDFSAVQTETVSEQPALEPSASSEALQRVDAWVSRDAPTLDGSNQDFVIEVLSSGAGRSAGAERSWIGSSGDGDSRAVYVADQLSSSEVGWSGERLPF